MKLLIKGLFLKVVMFKQSLIIFLVSLLFVVSCKDNITEPPTISDVKILHPNGGEKLIAGETDTIEWSNPETIETLGIYYSIDNGSNWISLINNEKIPSGKFLWTIPNVFTNKAKVKISAFSGESSFVEESDTVFQISRRLDVFTPTTLDGLESDTLKFIPNYKYNSLEFYYATNKVTLEYHPYEGYSSWNDVKWVNIESNCTFPDSTFVWSVPSQGGPYKIKIIASFADKAITYYTNEFQVNQKNITIFSPKINDIFNFPQNTLIEWESLSNVPEKIELYYSKFNINKTSNWILIDDKINPNSNSYNWEIPSIYSNEVKLKIVTIDADSNIVYGISDNVFTIHDNNVLDERRIYVRNYGLGNKWIYLATKDFVWYDDEEYFILEEVIDDKLESGIEYYNVIHQEFKDSVIISNSWVADRESFSSPFVMQDGDSYVIEDNTYGGAFSLKESEENVFSVQQKIQISGFSDAYTRRTTKVAKDIGMYNYYNMVEGNLEKRVLVGAYIDGVLYGDTNIVR